MPAVVAAVAGYAAGAAVAGAAVTAGLVVAGSIGAAVISGVTSMVVSSLVGGALSDGPQQQQQSSGGAASSMSRGILLNTSSTADPIPVIYGSRRVGGIRTFTESSGSGNEYLNIVLTLCEGEVGAINTVYIDGVASDDAKFAGLVTIEKHLGRSDQVASAGLIAEFPGVWTSNHIGVGLAYVWVKLKYDQNVFRGFPTITADVDGKVVLDVRDDTYKFSPNPALCIRDYLTNPLYGRGIPDSMIRDASFISSANTCDITYTAPDTNDYPQYTCNGVVNTDQNSAQNATELLSCCRGYLLFDSNGYGLLIDKAETPTTFEFNEDNITGGWNISPGGKRQRANRVRGRWFNPDREWQPDIWPADSPEFRAQDNGLLLEQQLSLPFTSDVYQAQMITERYLRQSRFGTMLRFKSTIAGLDCEVGDVVPVRHSTPGYEGKPFRVMRMRLLSSDEIEVDAMEYDGSVHSDVPLIAPRETPVTNLPDPSSVGIPGSPTVTEYLYETTGSAGLKVSATMTWGAAADAFNGGYLPEYKASADSVWIELPKALGLSAEILDITPGSYHFRVRAENVMGFISDYSATTTKEILGLIAPPEDITGFSVRVVSGQALVTLNRATDIDVLIGGRVVVRWTPSVVAVGWNDGVLLSSDNYPGDSSSFYVPLVAGTYLAKFEDSTGNLSVNAASFIVTDAAMTGFTASGSITEHPTFAGAKTNVVVLGGGLQIDGNTLWDAIPDIDAETTIDFAGGIQASGMYVFANQIDIGAVFTVKLFPHIKSVGFDTGDLWDSRTTPIDDWGMIDGSVIDDAECHLEIRTTNDDPSGSPVWGAWHALPGQADYTCRGIQARLIFSSAMVTHNRLVTELSLAVKQPT